MHTLFKAWAAISDNWGLREVSAVCVCVCARARACVCVCTPLPLSVYNHSRRKSNKGTWERANILQTLTSKSKISH